MAIAPRLDLRQSQALVMTPQLRQAIQLLQFSNLEAASFVEQELERNPLLERDDAPEFPDTERAAPDQIAPSTGRETDAAEAAAAETLPTDAAAPLDAEMSDTFDPGGTSDGAPLTVSAERRVGSGFEADERGIDAFAAERPTLREHLSEQLRLSFADPVERMIGAHLIALL